jgi:hypothetical protein
MPRRNTIKLDRIPKINKSKATRGSEVMRCDADVSNQKYFDKIVVWLRASPLNKRT